MLIVESKNIFPIVGAFVTKTCATSARVTRFLDGPSGHVIEPAAVSVWDNRFTLCIGEELGMVEIAACVVGVCGDASWFYGFDDW